MKLYLDNSFLNRPFDDFSIKQNQVEAEVLEWIIEWVKDGKVQLINSDVIEYENSHNPFPERQTFIEETMKLATTYQDFTQTIRQRAKVLREEFNLSLYDARHLASAETAGADLFITCDYALAKKCKGRFNVTTPLSTVQYYENNH